MRAALLLTAVLAACTAATRAPRSTQAAPDGAAARPRVRFDAAASIYSASGLPAISADGQRIAVLHVVPNAEDVHDDSGELRVIDLSDHVVQRIDNVAAMNRYLGGDRWFALRAGEPVTHCPHGYERDSDERYCELHVGSLALHYAEPHLQVTRGHDTVLDQAYVGWSAGEVQADDSDYGRADNGIAAVAVDADERALLVTVTYHRYGDEEYGPDDVEHVIWLP